MLLFDIVEGVGEVLKAMLDGGEAKKSDYIAHEYSERGDRDSARQYYSDSKSYKESSREHISAARDIFSNLVNRSDDENE